MKIFPIHLLTAFLLLQTCCLAAEQSGVQRTEDVIYGRKAGMALTMDVFQPPNPNGCGIIYLVNGGWLSSKNTPRMQSVMPENYQHFLKRGYTVFAVVTSSQPVFKIPDLIKDVHRAVRFVRLNAPRFGVDPGRLGVTGSSSGGHLTLIAATQGDPGNPNSDDPVEKQSSAVRAAACFFPPTDFLNCGGPDIDGCGVGRLAPLAAAFGPKAATESGRQILGKEISPIYYITAKLPPTLIIHGNADETVPLQQSESFVQRAKDAGVKNIELIVREGNGHGWPKDSCVWKSDEDMKEIVDWFDRFLKG